MKTAPSARSVPADAVSGSTARASAASRRTRTPPSGRNLVRSGCGITIAPPPGYVVAVGAAPPRSRQRLDEDAVLVRAALEDVLRRADVRVAARPVEGERRDVPAPRREPERGRALRGCHRLRALQEEAPDAAPVGRALDVEPDEFDGRRAGRDRAGPAARHLH